jgi:hypothetical protein
VFDFPADEDTVKQATGSQGQIATLAVSKGTFARGMNGDITLVTDLKTTQSITDELQTARHVAVIGEPVELTFDTVQASAQDSSIVVSIELSQQDLDQVNSESKVVYAYVKHTGNRLTAAEGDSPVERWSLAPGDLESTDEGAVLHVRIYSSAEKVTIAAVIGERFHLYVDTQTLSAARSPQQSTPPQVIDRPWVILCHSENEEDCNTDAGSNSPLVNAPPAFAAAAQTFSNMDFTDLDIISVSLSDAARLAYEDSLVTLDPETAFHVQVNVAMLIEPPHCEGVVNPVGCYDPGTRELTFGKNAIVRDPADPGNPIAHELAHAIQSAMAPDLFRADNAIRNRWVTEGIADALAYWHEYDQSPQTVLSSMTINPRHWAFSLQDQSFLHHPYATREFFARQFNGSLDWLFDLLTILRSTDVTTHPYEFMDEALRNIFRLYDSPREGFYEWSDIAESVELDASFTAESDLGIAYLNVVWEESPVTGYPYCEQEWTLDLPEGSGLKFDSISDMISPFSTDCRQVVSLDHAERHGNACLKLTLESADANSSELILGETNQQTVLVVSQADAVNAQGNLQFFSFDGEPLWVNSDEFVVKIVDLNRDEGVLASTESQRQWTLTAEIDGAGDCTESCYPTKITCTENACNLWMNSPGTDCWGRVARCDASGCFVRMNGEFVPNSLSDCSGIRSSLQSFTNPPSHVDGVEITSWTIPNTSTNTSCNGADFCRRIILCAE